MKWAKTKTIDHLLAPNEGLLKRWCWPFQLWPWGPFYPKIQIVQKVIVFFIEYWEDTVPWFWLIWTTWRIFFFLEIFTFFILVIFRRKWKVKMDQKSTFLIHPPFFKTWFLQNLLHGICTAIRNTCGQIFSLIRPYLLEFRPKTPQNWPNWVPN